MLRRTKIVATLGPAVDSTDALERMIAEGVDIVRANFSHGSRAEHKKCIQRVRDCAAKLGRTVGILVDLQGPKIRIARFKNDKIILEEDATFILDADFSPYEGTQEIVGIDYKQLPQDLKIDNILLLDDGRIQLIVKKIVGSQIICHVIAGGELSNHKGINLKGGGLTADAITQKDRDDLKTAAELGVDYIALSFPRNADDILRARALLNEANSKAGIIAKIERTEAVAAIDEIIDVSDGVMVARGDLAVEIGDAEVPAVQKHIIHRARAANKPVITATQMMESMIHSTVPTRAEVSDVANAVLDGTDAVMLSAETAVGDHPDKVIAAVSRICLGVEKHPQTQLSRHRVDKHFTRVDEAVAMAAMYVANHMDIRAIIALTESGATPLWMSRIHSGIPIYGMSRHALTRGKMALYRDVYPIDFDLTHLERQQVNRAAVAELQKRGIVKKGDLVALTKGDDIGIHGGTNVLKILEVGNIDLI